MSVNEENELNILSRQSGIKYYELLNNVDISYIKFQDMVNVLYKSMEAILDGKKMDLQNISHLVAKLMVEIESICKLDGSSKKSLLMVIMKIYLDKQNGDDTSDLNLESFINIALSGMIDTMIAIDKKHISVNLVAKTCCIPIFNKLMK